MAGGERWLLRQGSLKRGCRTEGEACEKFAYTEVGVSERLSCAHGMYSMESRRAWT